MGNATLNKANKAKNDEFYTQISDIERECWHYKQHFKGKVVFCNCDDPDTSNFWRYFHMCFNLLGIKKLISTHFVYEDMFTPGDTYKIVYEGGSDGDFSVGAKTVLKENGDFRSAECIEILKEADIVVTNPPFSLFREYVAQLVEHGKQFLIIGNQNNIGYKDTFKLIKENKMWLGVDNGGTKWFQVPAHYEIQTETRIKIDDKGIKYFSMGNIAWYTNLDHEKRHEGLILFRQYNQSDYPKYDNYDAVEVSRIADIPIGYDGVMGVPITFLDKYNPSQFEIIGQTGVDITLDKGRPYINGKRLYTRLLIKNKETL